MEKNSNDLPVYKTNPEETNDGVPGIDPEFCKKMDSFFFGGKGVNWLIVDVGKIRP